MFAVIYIGKFFFFFFIILYFCTIFILNKSLCSSHNAPHFRLLNDELFVTEYFGYSERGLGFSGYGDDDNEPLSKSPTATRPKMPEQRVAGRQISSSDINRNSLKTPQTADNNVTGKDDNRTPIDTEVGERLDKNQANDKRNTPSQVCVCLPCSKLFVPLTSQPSRSYSLSSVL